MSLHRVAGALRRAGSLLRAPSSGGIDINLIKVVIAAEQKAEKGQPPC